MLKNPKLLGLLRSPDEPDGEPLKIEGDFLVNAGWPVPVVEGIPDFVTNAPPIRRSLEFVIPMQDNPSPAVLKFPSPCKTPPPWFREEINKYSLLNGHPKGYLLDAGCGQGNRQTFERLGYDYIALDISFNSQQCHSGPADVDVVADCHRLPFPSGSMEAVNCAGVIEHLYCPPLAIQQIHRVLKSGGLLVGSCSFLEGEHYDSQIHYTYLGLYRLLKTAGFAVEHIHPGRSVWEMHSHSIYCGLPGHKWLGKLHKAFYLNLVRLKSREPWQTRLLRHAAILFFMARKA